MNKKFTVIQGNLNSKVISDDQVTFVSAYVTDTRLMGVVVLYISWERDFDSSGYHQFFYFDAEEYGLESFSSLPGDDSLSLLTLENALTGGLGGRKIKIDENEARYLINHFASYNENLSSPLPQPVSEYEFLLKPLSADQSLGLFPLMHKMCVRIENKYELINYFLMRSFARDREALEYLSGGRPLLPYQGKPATLHKNTIHKITENEKTSYICESLIETNQQFMLVITEIWIKHSAHEFYIQNAHMTSSMKVTQSEAALMLMRSEYITVYDVLDIDEFLSPFLSYASSFAKTPYDDGTLFIQFNADNSHVRSMNFRLNHDVTGLYYLSEFGQLIVASYDEITIKELESRLGRRSIEPYLLLEDRFEFKSPILYEFILSGFDDFLEFVTSLE